MEAASGGVTGRGGPYDGVAATEPTATLPTAHISAMDLTDEQRQLLAYEIERQSQPLLPWGITSGDPWMRQRLAARRRSA